MDIRGGTRADLEAVARIHADSWRDSYRGIMDDAFLDGPVLADRRDAWTLRLETPPDPSALLIAEDDGLVLGFAYVCPDDASGDEAPGDEAPGGEASGGEASGSVLLDNLHVSASHRSKGIGLALMHAMGTTLSDLGHTPLRLLVLEGNDGACRFYDRLGGQRQPIVWKGFRGLGPFASIPFTWVDFPAAMARAGTVR